MIDKNNRNYGEITQSVLDSQEHVCKISQNGYTFNARCICGWKSIDNLGHYLAKRNVELHYIRELGHGFYYDKEWTSNYE